MQGERAGTRTASIRLLQLERIRHLDTFWFAWSSYRPDTVLLD